VVEVKTPPPQSLRDGNLLPISAAEIVKWYWSNVQTVEKG
jgi:hypothetical protein